MDLSELTNNEVRHPWERARAHALKRIMGHYDLLNNNFSYLDVGCGDAFALSFLLNDYNPKKMDGIDINLSVAQADKFAKSRPNLSLFNSFDALNGASYDVVLLLDVLEHVQQDHDLIKNLIEKYLNPEGYAIITVPSVNWLFTGHDRYLGHFRRYTMKNLRACLGGLGMVEIGHGFLFASLLPVRFYEWFFEKITGKRLGPQGAGHWNGKEPMTKIITSFFNIEHRVLFYFNRLGLNLPGLSIWMILHKEKDHV